MKISKSFIIAISLAFTCVNTGASAQTFNAEICINEVYGSVAAELPTETLTWLGSCLSRCSVLTAEELGSEVFHSLESVPLNDKYGAALSYDLAYDASTFNPLKYQFNFHQSVDQFFKIGSSNYFLKIEAKP